jgi:hypothetical protein
MKALAGVLDGLEPYFEQLVSERHVVRLGACLAADPARNAALSGYRQGA